LAGLSPPLKKGDLRGFQVLIKIPPDPPLGKGGKKNCLSDVTLIMEQTTKIIYLRATEQENFRNKANANLLFKKAES